MSNLNRQALYRNKGIGNGKAKYANEELKRVNPNVKVETISEMINNKDGKWVKRKYGRYCLGKESKVGPVAKGGRHFEDKGKLLCQL